MRRREAVVEPQGGEHGAVEERGEGVRDGVAEEVEDAVEVRDVGDRIGVREAILRNTDAGVCAE